MTTKENTVIRPADTLGMVLSSRFAAVELRNDIEQELRSGADVVVDFEGVIGISPSFADELFAKLPEGARREGRLRFVNLDEDLLAIARFVREGRGLTE